jgi:hypothetical protein
VKKPVAVEGMTMTFGDTVPGSVTLGSASVAVSVDGAGVYAGPVTIALVGASNAQAAATGGTGAGTFEPTAEYCSVDGQKVLRVGDKAEFKVTGVDAKLNPVTWDVTATIVDAGQSNTTAE